MNIEEKRKEVIKENFPMKKILIAICTLIIGIWFMYMFITNIINSEDYDEDWQDILVMIGLTCLGISIYILNDYFHNVILKPKKEVMYLDNKNKYICVYVNKKGRRFAYKKDDSKEEGKYYTVLKTKDYIYDVLEEVSENNNWASEILDKKEDSDKLLSSSMDIMGLMLLIIIILPLSYIATEKTSIANSSWYIPILCLSVSTITTIAFIITKVIHSLLKKIGININDTSIVFITAMCIAISILYIFGKVILKLNF